MFDIHGLRHSSPCHVLPGISGLQAACSRWHTLTHSPTSPTSPTSPPTSPTALTHSPTHSLHFTSLHSLHSLSHPSLTHTTLTSLTHTLTHSLYMNIHTYTQTHPPSPLHHSYTSSSLLALLWSV